MIYHRYARANNNKLAICENILGSIGVDHWFVCSKHGLKNITSLLAFNYQRIPEKLTISKRTCEEASYEKHGKVVREEEDQPTSNKGRSESKHEPLLTDSWETDGWMELVFMDKDNLRFDWGSGLRLLEGNDWKKLPPAKSGTRAEPSMKMATPRFSWSPSRAWGWLSTSIKLKLKLKHNLKICFEKFDGEILWKGLPPYCPVMVMILVFDPDACMYLWSPIPKSKCKNNGKILTFWWKPKMFLRA